MPLHAIRWVLRFAQDDKAFLPSRTTCQHRLKIKSKTVPFDSGRGCEYVGLSQLAKREKLRRFLMLKRFTVCIFLLAALVTLAFAADENQNVCQGDSGKWQQLFNGKDLTGWKHVGPGGDTVEDGLIRTHGGMGLLYWTGGKLSNCVIRVVYKMRDNNDNSGVFIRIPIEPREEWMPVHYGYEVQIDNHPETSNEKDYHITR